MPSLLDIAPPELSAETIDIRGTSIKVAGIGADVWAALYSRFPQLRAIVTGREPEGGTNPAQSVGAQLAMVVAGARAGDPEKYLGKTDDELERFVRSHLTSEEQLEVMTAVMRLSLPGNVMGPLLDLAAKDFLRAAAAAAPSGGDPDTK